jgi:hypothetical protein
VHVDLRMSKADRQVALFLDGALIKDWIDPSGFAGEGTGVRFVNNSLGGAVKMSNFRVSKWNGVLDDGLRRGPGPFARRGLLESGAKISGAVVSIAERPDFPAHHRRRDQCPAGRASAIEFARLPGPGAAGFRGQYSRHFRPGRGRHF